MTSLYLAAPLTLEDAVLTTTEAVSECTSETSSMASQYAAEIAWGLIVGQLRGRIPYPVPIDLMAVATSVAIRWTAYLANPEQVKISGDNVTGFMAPQFTGFLLSELIVLWRYRIRTA